ncbi:recombinase family protein [Deinococcus peraridilitoris]|uniref:Site-specific recombinase, DNA invertase Pin n=1 Tax=Deinococcus peraridilitoris (strain DSM 19664 / LMG 22246 / CIP 109416 / KR-200) TaxID=937777 RepID=L0A9M2_DEIPD|nr:recombinase family protein [Deinococcus peraridilitoris]AFZ69755.1 site-specific recombinase, DNA invertase Pin [Deinococcus peraridilitoris DSM 19664]
MPGTLIGYARVSTDDQTTDLQLDALKGAGVLKVYQETASGGRWDRPELHRMLEFLREGDIVVVWKVDRLSRSLADLVRIMEMIKARGARLKSLTEPIDTSTPAGEAMMQLIGVFAQLERANLRERTHAGIKAARAKGVKFGRPSKLSEAQRQDIIRRVSAGDLTAAEAARLYGVNPTTIARVIKRHRAMTVPFEGRAAEVRGTRP